MICDRCKKKKICWTYKDKPPKECSRFRPFTHFDRIKAMSVEEMAELLVSYEADMDCYFIYGGKGRKFYNRDNAISAEIQYLESEAQEDD